MRLICRAFVEDKTFPLGDPITVDYIKYLCDLHTVFLAQIAKFHFSSAFYFLYLVVQDVHRGFKYIGVAFDRSKVPTFFAVENSERGASSAGYALPFVIVSLDSDLVRSTQQL